MNSKFPKQVFILLIIGIFSGGTINSQNAPIKFGKVSMEELKMKNYRLDSSADAVVLCDYGKLDPEALQFTQTIRIKILRKEGTDWANLLIPRVPKASVRGVTYNLENGKIVESKLKNESVFMERVVENLYRMRIGMPNVREGSVVEIKYSFTGIPYEWEFQKEIPVKYSELRMPGHPNYELKKVFSGYTPLSESSRSRWIARNVPAFHPEPYINSAENYLTKFNFEISSINFPGFIFRDYSSSWDAVNLYFVKHPNFGEKTQGLFVYLNEDVRRIEESGTSDWEKIVEAYETVRRNVKWDETYNLYADDNLGFIYNKKNIGTSADMNFLLYQLLSRLGINAHLMVISTRDNGMINPYFPSINHFNHVIVYVKSGDRDTFLDATDRFVPAGLVPENSLNGKGFVIGEMDGYWVDIPVNSASELSVLCDMTIEEDGSIKGNVSFKRSDYAASRFRKRRDGFNSDKEFLDDFERENGGCRVMDFQADQLDSLYLPVKDKYTVEMENKSSRIGDMLYVEPVLFESIKENPFRREKREYPVDFTCPLSVRYIATLTLPDAFKVEELPEPCRVVMPDNTASFKFQAVSMGNKIQVVCQYSANKPIYLQNEYPNLKEFYDQMVIKLAEPLVLKTDDDEN